MLTSPLRVRYDDRWGDVVDVFTQDLATAVGWEVRRVFDGEAWDVRLTLDDTLGDEDYTLRVSDCVDITASSAAGCSYALTTLRQLGPAQLFSYQPTSLTSWTIPGVVITDGPAYEWRGAHLDVARHFFDVPTVVRLIDHLAAHRMNKLHLHLNDDQGWRIEVPAWPRLTEVGATRASSPLGHEHENRHDDQPHGGFYRASDIATIIEHARRRNVEVIPEIDLPGHAQAVLAAYPQFANVDDPLEVWTRWGVSEHVLNVEPSTLDFAVDVVRYVASLFPGSPVHIGGDECPSAEWEVSPAAFAVMRRNGFERASELQGLFTTRLASVLREDGREVLAWDEVLDAQVAPGTVIFAWRCAQKGLEAIERGFDVVMAPMQHLYLDWLSSDAPDEPVAVAPVPSVTTWEKVYSYEVVPRGLDARSARHVRGAQVQLWTEYIDSVPRLDYMAFPRICAFSEVAWGTSGRLEEFRTRLVNHLARLDAMGIAYRPLDPWT